MHQPPGYPPGGGYPPQGYAPQGPQPYNPQGYPPQGYAQGAPQPGMPPQQSGYPPQGYGPQPGAPQPGAYYGNQPGYVQAQPMAQQPQAQAPTGTGAWNMPSAQALSQGVTAPQRGGGRTGDGGEIYFDWPGFKDQPIGGRVTRGFRLLGSAEADGAYFYEFAQHRAEIGNGVEFSYCHPDPSKPGYYQDEVCASYSASLAQGLKPMNGRLEKKVAFQVVPYAWDPGSKTVIPDLESCKDKAGILRPQLLVVSRTAASQITTQVGMLSHGDVFGWGPNGFVFMIAKVKKGAQRKEVEYELALGPRAPIPPAFQSAQPYNVRQLYAPSPTDHQHRFIAKAGLPPTQGMILVQGHGHAGHSHAQPQPTYQQPQTYGPGPTGQQPGYVAPVPTHAVQPGPGMAPQGHYPPPPINPAWAQPQPGMPPQGGAPPMQQPQQGWTPPPGSAPPPMTGQPQGYAPPMPGQPAPGYAQQPGPGGPAPGQPGVFYGQFQGGQPGQPGQVGATVGGQVAPPPQQQAAPSSPYATAVPVAPTKRPVAPGEVLKQPLVGLALPDGREACFGSHSPSTNPLCAPCPGWIKGQCAAQSIPAGSGAAPGYDALQAAQQAAKAAVG